MTKTGRSMLTAALAEPARQLSGPADGAQPAFGLLTDRGGGDDEQPVAGLQHGGGAGAKLWPAWTMRAGFA